MNSSTIPQCRDDKDESVACVHVDKSAILERLKTVSGTWILMGRYNHSLSLDDQLKPPLITAVGTYNSKTAR